MIVASSRSRERKKDDKVAHGGGILHLGQQSQIIYTPTHGHMELMGIDQAGEFPPGTLASSGLGQQIIILVEENTAKGVRAIKQFRVAPESAVSYRMDPAQTVWDGLPLVGRPAGFGW